MGRSIALKVFGVAASLWLVILVIQVVVLNFYFEDIYLAKGLSKYHRELSRAALGFTEGGEDTSSQALRRYTTETGSPVMVITAGHQIADREL